MDTPTLRLSRRHLLTGGLALFALPATAGASHAAEEAGVVRQLTGAATAAAGAAVRPLNAAAAVFVDDLVKTGQNARLGLALGARTTLNLGAETEIKIDRYLKDAGGEINLVTGSMMFERKGKPAATDLSIRSPYGLIAVRGTRFHAGRMSDGQFGVLVGTGSVAVTAGGKTVMVGANQGTFIRAPGAAPTAPRAWSAAKVREITSAVR